MNAWWLVVGAGVALAQAGVIGALIVESRRRRRLDAAVREGRRFRGTLGDVLLGITKNPASRASQITSESLRKVADAIGVDDVWPWQFGDPSDPQWTLPRLQRGEAVVLADPHELPRPLRQRAAAASVMATPLVWDGRVSGAFLWVSASGSAVWSLDVIGRCRTLSNIFACELQRKEASEALEHGDALKSAILSSLPADVAVLDRLGAVIAVNAPWTDGVWAREDGGAAIVPGANYLDVCRAAARAGSPGAADALLGVGDVCGGRRVDFELEYRAPHLDVERWFLIKATRLKREAGGAVLTHADITERKRAEMMLRESEERFHRLADALPVAVWMSGVDGGCTYANRTWLDLTGRQIERELGEGWLELVHPDDLENLLATYRRAFSAREPLSMEYRIRRHDGQYRWMLDQGVPRYDAHGAFLGYVGGAVDFTDRRLAERALQHLGGKLIAAQEDERRRIARDLHDSVSQRLALLSIGLDELKRLVASQTDASAIVHRMSENTTTVADEVHSLSHRLHSAKLEALGLVAAVSALCRETSAQGVRVQFEPDAEQVVPADVALCLFRIAQEALANVVKHSGASTARVALSAATNVVVLRVEDAGCGFVSDGAADGLGLISMRERARSVGGDIIVRSLPGLGTAIETRIPVPRLSALPAPAEAADMSSLRHAECPPLLLLSDGSESSLG